MDSIIKTLATELYPLSVNRDETDRFLARNIDGEIEITEDLGGLRAMLEDFNRGCGQEQYDKTWEVISRGDHFQYFRNEVYDVMYEEAGRFFSGNNTAKQAAEYVQNRISIYLAEQGYPVGADAHFAPRIFCNPGGTRGAASPTMTPGHFAETVWRAKESLDTPTRKTFLFPYQ